MISFVLLTNQAPSKLADELLLAGYQVYEALAISEVLHLCEYYDIAAVLIVPGLEPPGLDKIQRHCITVKLNETALPKDILWELSHLFPTSTSIQ